MSPQAEQLFALVRRYPLSVACLAITVLCGGGGWYLHRDIADLAEPYAQRAKEYDDMLALTKGGRTQREELEAVRDITRRIDENLVIADELIDNNNYFYKFESKSGVHLSQLHQLNSPSTDNSPLFRRIPWSLRVSGTYEQVAAFLLALETGPRLAKITSFSITRSTATGKGTGSRASGEVAVDPTGPASVVLDLSLEMLGKK